jgi:hypothetical protein
MSSYEISAAISIVIVMIINIALLVFGILLNMRGSPFYGTIIRIETDEWSKSPVVSISSKASSSVCPNSLETI